MNSGARTHLRHLVLAMALCALGVLGSFLYASILLEGTTPTDPFYPILMAAIMAPLGWLVALPVSLALGTGDRPPVERLILLHGAALPLGYLSILAVLGDLTLLFQRPESAWFVMCLFLMGLVLGAMIGAVELRRARLGEPDLGEVFR